MSSDYYFKKWKNTLANLENLIELDHTYQETKINDKKRCDAVERLTGILGRYIASYNDALDCLQQNLQVQKTVYMTNIVKALVERILELKQQLRKLEGSYYQFLSNGMLEHKLNPDDVEFSSIPSKYERSAEITEAIRIALQNANQIQEEEISRDENQGSDQLLIDKWWEDQVEVNKKERKKLNMAAVYEIERKISEETLNRKRNVSIIQAHEKTRQVTRINTKEKLRREKWEKELQGTLNPPARIDLRERSAKLIQNVLRFYFELKRKKIEDCKRDELLQLRYYSKPVFKQTVTDIEIKNKQLELYKMYEEERKLHCEKFKKYYLEKKHDDILEDTRDNIRNWFHDWYKEVKVFYDIPKESNGGSTLILKEVVPSPAEWKEKYEAYLENKKANKNKTAMQIKWEKQIAKKEEMILKIADMKKKKLEAELLRKIMKNPRLHPGYIYPISKISKYLVQTIKDYYRDWLDLDNEDTLAVKEKFIKNIDEMHICMEAKLDVIKIADVDMREELKLLNSALKEDYKTSKEQIPENMKEKVPRTKKQRRRKMKLNDDKYDLLNDLAVKGVLKEYPRTNFKDFLGDSNYAGDDIRCKLGYGVLEGKNIKKASNELNVYHRPPLHFAAEIRAVWWECCREAFNGFKRILLVGPRGCGKTTLVHIMATNNDAVLYELDPSLVADENQTTALQQLVSSVATCAKLTQPSIIYIRDVHKLYYKKVSSETLNNKFDLIKRFLIRQLFKRIHRRDNVTVIGTCVEPWLTKSKQMLKIFSTVLLLPDTSYSAVYLILQNWVTNNRIVPPDLDIHSLAYVLQGYSFGYLLGALDNFLTANRIVKIAAYGLTPQDVYNYILEDNEIKIDYKRYLKWYTERTHWGKVENKRLQEDKEFQLLLTEWNKKMQKKKAHKQNVLKTST